MTEFYTDIAVDEFYNSKRSRSIVLNISYMIPGVVPVLTFPPRWE